MKRRNSRVSLAVLAAAMLGIGAAGAQAGWIAPSWRGPTVSPTAAPVVKPHQSHRPEAPANPPELKLIVSAPLRVPGGDEMVVDAPVRVTPIPEPATSTLVVIAGMALCYRPRRRGRDRAKD